MFCLTWGMVTQGFLFFGGGQGLFVCHIMQLMGSQFPDQGLNSGRGVESPES